MTALQTNDSEIGIFGIVGHICLRFVCPHVLSSLSEHAICPGCVKRAYPTGTTGLRLPRETVICPFPIEMPASYQHSAVYPLHHSPGPFKMATAEALDADITDLRERIEILQAHRANIASILLSQPHLPTRLEQRPVLHERNRRSAAKLVQKQSTRNLENVYRACAGITAYKVKDPDPCAVDDGNVLGVRIEVSIRARFIETYHVLFNRPNVAHANVLKIHKHTIPPCIPLQPLANKWLPMAKKSAEEPKEQDLVKFGRHLRKELVSWHLRLDALEKLRRDANLPKETVPREGPEVEPPVGMVLNAFASDDEDSEEEESSDEHAAPLRISRIDADTAVREITIGWSNGRVGIFKVTKDGEVERSVVRAKDGSRESSFSVRALGRVEGLVQRLDV